MEVTRDFAVATFVVHEGRVLLLYHRRLGMWLPPGGHIEPNELPDDAAVREVFEETGIRVELVGERALPVEYPRQLVRPRGVQVERIAPGHEHIDLVYFARPIGSVEIRPNDEVSHVGWYGPAELAQLPLTEEIRMWVELALKSLSSPQSL
ncbi:MAG: NUDIX hydrolase [Bacillota bacterium]|nr:NUDIX hydrolase [Bacillota bacterium]REJ36847.1 MAG: NUDIX hydrolase [Bacillota bacterium]